MGSIEPSRLKKAEPNDPPKSPGVREFNSWVFGSDWVIAVVIGEDRSKGSGLLVCLLGETNPRAAAWADGGVQFEAVGNRLDPSGVTQWLASLGRYPDC